MFVPDKILKQIDSMRSFFISLIFLTILNFSFGQSTPDSTNKEIRSRRDLVFTRAEIMPEYKFGLPALADSVKKSLLKDGFEFSPAKISVVLTVSKYGDVTDVRISARAEISQADLIKKSLRLPPECGYLRNKMSVLCRVTKDYYYIFPKPI